MKTDYTNIKHFTFSSVHSSTITEIPQIDDDNLISIEIKEDQFNGVELKFNRNYFIDSLVPFFTELKESEKEAFINLLTGDNK